MWDIRKWTEDIRLCCSQWNYAKDVGSKVSEDSSVQTHSENLRCDQHSPTYITSVHTLSHTSEDVRELCRGDWGV
jgi:hypothetical protein